VKYRQYGNSQGSLTVEAALIIPIIIFVLFWLVNIAFVLYQYAALQSLANQGVEAAQAGWDNTSKDIRTGRLENASQLDDEWLYWNVIDRDRNKKERSLKQWIQKRAQKDPLMALFTRSTGHGGLTIDVNEKNTLSLRRAIEVRITDNRHTLFSPLRSLFGLDLTNQVTVVSRGTIEDPAEFIRNLDWGADLYSEHINDNPEGNLAKATQKISDIRKKCIGFLE